MTISPMPWRHEDAGLIQDAKHQNVAWLTSQVLIHEGNGPLIAAAPALHAALRELVTRIEAVTIIPNPSTGGHVVTRQWLELEPELAAARYALKACDPK